MLVELKARFDEATNVSWAKTLERAGVHVVYGLVGLKTHAKCVLVVRNDDDGLRRYCHVGTGNYNSKHRPVVRRRRVHHLRSRRRRRRHPAVQPPHRLQPHPRVPHLAGGAARDAQPAARPDRARGRLRQPRARSRSSSTRWSIPQLIEALYEASRAGVSIDLFIRGICCLVPGVPGMSETIRVRSQLGRYLEHSRIMWFAHGDVSGGGHPSTVPHRSRCTSSGRPTGCNATSIGASRCWCPSAIPSTRCGSTTSSSSCSIRDIVRWELDADGIWHRRGPENFADGDGQERFYRWVADRQRR